MSPESKIPIILGVTGHRSILKGSSDETKIRRSVEALIDSFRVAYQGTPIVLLSSLAEGADQICAEIALTRGLRVVSPLPFPAEVYKASTTFITEEGRRKFDCLRDNPNVEPFQVPLPGDDIPSDVAGWHAKLGEDQFRRACYVAAGVYIAQHCHALIALWDGLPTDHPAGTYPIVRFKLTGELPKPYPWSRHMFQTADSGPVFVVHTPRASEASSDKVGSIRELSPGGNPEQLAQENAWPDTAEPKWTANQASKIITCKRLHEFNDELGKIKPPASDLTLTPIDRARNGAGRLARSYHSWVKFFSASLYILMGLSLLFLHLYAHDFVIEKGEPLHDEKFLWAYLALLTGVFLVVGWVGWRQLERKWLDFRALAEALRVQSFWLRSGVRAPAASSYLRQVHSELSWIRRALWASIHASPPTGIPFASLTSPDQLGILETIRKEWLVGQCIFYSKYEQNHKWNERLHWSALGLAIVGWAFAFVMMTRPEHPHNFLLVASGTLIVSGGLLIAYRDRELLSELARQYERMSVLFSHADFAMKLHLKDGDVASSQQLIEDLGREALSENASWLILHRSRPFEIPMG